MDWIKIPINDIMFSRFKDHELITLIKYQALYSKLEEEPNMKQLSHSFTKKQIVFLQNNKELMREFIENQIEKVKSKRHNEKERYHTKQTVYKNLGGRKFPFW